MSQVISIFVLDNGAHTIKAGFAQTDEDRDATLARLTSQRRQKGPWNSKENKALVQQLDDELDSRYECVTVANSMARSVKDKVTYVSDELAQCMDFGGLVFRSPFERVCLGRLEGRAAPHQSAFQGILTFWDCQRTIWDHVFDKMEVSLRTSSRSDLVVHDCSGPGQPARDFASGDRAVLESAERRKYVRPDDL